MATLTTPDVMLNKVVVAYLDGRRSRGCVYDFSPLKDTFRLVSESGLLQQKGTEVALKELKAVFFVKEGKRGNNYPFHAGHNQDHLMDSVFRDRLAIQLEK
jgi:hypothetical protein